MQKADCNAVGIKGFAHLRGAVRYGHRGDAVQLFLAVPDVDFDTACTTGRTSLQYAAMEVHHDFVELLVVVRIYPEIKGRWLIFFDCRGCEFCF